MARFKGVLRGSRGEVTRLGTPASGMTARANGWNLGGEVRMGAEPDSTRDRLSLSINSGSNGHGTTKDIVIVEEGQDGKLVARAHVVVVVEGGIVQSVSLAGMSIDAEIRDYDVEGVEEDRIEKDAAGDEFVRGFCGRDV